jgi:DNA-binding CsgD family transcriptional regulator
MAGLVAVQALCAAFFVVDAIGDLGVGASAHALFEALVAASLVVGVAFGALALRAALDQRRRAETGLAAASGAFGALMETRFAQWRLTPAEHDVALLSIKGLSVAEIAAARGSAEGTVRAQAARVYAKAGVSGRAQLLGLFVEELVEGALAPAGTGQGAPPPPPSLDTGGAAQPR